MNANDLPLFQPQSLPSLRLGQGTEDLLLPEHLVLWKKPADNGQPLRIITVPQHFNQLVDYLAGPCRQPLTLIGRQPDGRLLHPDVSNIWRLTPGTVIYSQGRPRYQVGRRACVAYVRWTNHEHAMLTGNDGTEEFTLELPQGVLADYHLSMALAEVD